MRCHSFSCCVLRIADKDYLGCVDSVVTGVASLINSPTGISPDKHFDRARCSVCDLWFLLCMLLSEPLGRYYLDTRSCYVNGISFLLKTIFLGDYIRQNSTRQAYHLLPRLETYMKHFTLFSMYSYQIEFCALPCVPIHYSFCEIRTCRSLVDALYAQSS